MTLLAIVEPIVIVLAILMVTVVVLVFLFAFTFMPWLQAFMSGTQVSMLSIIGMRLRRISVSTVLRFLIMAKQAGVSISCREMESAYLQGVDLEKVTLAMIHAKAQERICRFENLLRPN